MSSLSPLAAKCSPIASVGPGTTWLVELACSRPPNAVLAIVLDLSDSCSTMRIETGKFSRLVATLARNIPVWLYRLSSHSPFDREPYRVGDLQDGTLQISRWFDDINTRNC